MRRIELLNRVMRIRFVVVVVIVVLRMAGGRCGRQVREIDTGGRCGRQVRDVGRSGRIMVKPAQAGVACAGGCSLQF